MSKPLIKISDLYTNPAMSGGTSPIVAPGSLTLIVQGLPVLQMDDAINPVPDMALPMPGTVFHNGKPLVGQTGLTSQGGTFVLGTITVFIP